MHELDDHALLREYAERGAEEAFAGLVARHVNKVYSVALRHTGNPHQAEEITQAVFVILARKSRHLSKRVILSGWLYQTARLTAVTFIRGEIRRTRREQEACMQNIPNEDGDDVWSQIAPLLDTAMAGLSETDRHAVVLRYFDGLSLREVGDILGASEDAAKMRVNRAVEKLRQFFAKRGVATSTAVLTTIISVNSVQAAPAALAISATAVAIAKGATISTSTSTLIKGALKIMAWSKAKTAIVAGLVVLLAAGTTTLAVKEIKVHRVEVWREKYDPVSLSILGEVPPQVKILPAIPSRPGGNWGNDGHRMLGLGATAMDMIECAYGVSQGRIVVSAPLPKESFDFISNLPRDADKALQQEISKKLGLIGKRELIVTNAWLLVLRNPNAPELKPTTVTKDESSAYKNPYAGSYVCVNHPISDLVGFLEDCLKTPVVDQTGLTNRFDIEFIGGSTPESLKRTVLNEVGLELVPGHAPVEFLVIEKAN